MLSHIILIVQDVFDSSHMIFYSVKSRYKEFKKCREGEFEILCKNITLSKKKLHCYNTILLQICSL